MVDLAEDEPDQDAGGAASMPPIRNVAAITRSTSMPIIAAASRSNAVARIALPSRERATSSVSAAIIAKPEPTTTSRITQTCNGPASSATSGSTRSNVSYDRNSAP